MIKLYVKFFLILPIFLASYSFGDFEPGLSDKPVNCNGRLVHWNLYEISINPTTTGNTMGFQKYWMGFHRDGSVLSPLYLYAYDFGLVKSAAEKGTSDISLYESSDDTYLNISLNRTDNVRGCYVEFQLTGKVNSHPKTGTFILDEFWFKVNASGFISFNNSNNTNNVLGLADSFTLNEMEFHYMCDTYERAKNAGGPTDPWCNFWKKGQVSFTHIR
tara:strand:- start:1921 stop:2571 length:651 start_codon:yes stop_codon:yes gene_type:complete